MKNSIVIACCYLLLANACKKSNDNAAPSNYEQINRQHIAARESSMTSQAIAAINASGQYLLNPGDVVIYKSNLGRFGKLQIISIDPADNYKLTVRAVIYSDDGSVSKSSANLSIQGSYMADLDEMVESTSQGVIDFFWNRVNVETNLVPMVGAKFVRYNF